jgi:2-methylcitrate dehydratase PrpD
MKRGRNAQAHTEDTKGTMLSRRGLLQRGGWIIAAAALHPALGMADEQVGSHVIAELSKYMAGAQDRALPDEVIEKAKRHTLDTLAAMISGSELPPGRAAIRFARAYGGQQIATVVGSNILCGAIEAALTNGMLAHSDETDDSHSPSQSHPGCATIPAALAVGEQFGVSGTRLLRAITLGYDIGTRITMTLGALDFEDRSHRDAHSVAGGFGAAAAAGCAAGLNAQQMRWLLDYASQQSSGLYAWQRDKDHIEKAFVFAGMPARSGATAALVVQSGWTGVDDILSGADNFFLANEPEAMPEKLIDKLGERFEITRTNIKKWTVGSPIQAPLDAMENLLKQHQFNADQVQQVIVRGATHEVAIVNNRDIPDICLQHMIALMLADKTVSFHSAHDKQRMQDPAILRQRAKVQLVPSEELQKRLPSREAIVEITLTDGTHFSEHVTAVRGSAENPMDREEVVAKSRDLITPVLGAEICTKLIEKILNLEKVNDVRELRPLLQRA